MRAKDMPASTALLAKNAPCFVRPQMHYAQLWNAYGGYFPVMPRLEIVKNDRSSIASAVEMKISAVIRTLKASGWSAA
jgi:hypothetical protein